MTTVSFPATPPYTTSFNTFESVDQDDIIDWISQNTLEKHELELNQFLSNLSFENSRSFFDAILALENTEAQLFKKIAFQFAENRTEGLSDQSPSSFIKDSLSHALIHAAFENKGKVIDLVLDLNNLKEPLFQIEKHKIYEALAQTFHFPVKEDEEEKSEEPILFSRPRSPFEATFEKEEESTTTFLKIWTGFFECENQSIKIEFNFIKYLLEKKYSKALAKLLGTKTLKNLIPRKVALKALIFAANKKNELVVKAVLSQLSKGKSFKEIEEEISKTEGINKEILGFIERQEGLVFDVKAVLSEF